MKNIIQIFNQEIEKIRNSGKRPTLLLHTCCAICLSASFLQIKDYFDVTVYFYNPNIYPIDEYEKRKKEVLRLISIFQKEYRCDIGFIEEKDEFETYNQQKIHSKGCLDCFHLRLAKAYHYASINQFDYITTTLTLGRLKDSSLINSIAYSLQPNFSQVKYLYSDFKKNKGIDLSLECKEKYQLYAQCYCGCEPYYKSSL